MFKYLKEGVTLQFKLLLNFLIILETSSPEVKKLNGTTLYSISTLSGLN